MVEHNCTVCVTSLNVAEPVTLCRRSPPRITLMIQIMSIRCGASIRPHTPLLSFLHAINPPHFSFSDQIKTIRTWSHEDRHMSPSVGGACPVITGFNLLSRYSDVLLLMYRCLLQNEHYVCIPQQNFGGGDEFPEKLAASQHVTWSGSSFSTVNNAHVQTLPLYM